MDILGDLIQAYLTEIENNAGTGETLEWAESWYGVRNPLLLPASFQANLPLILCYPTADIPVSPDCLPAYKDRKIYTITLSIFSQQLAWDNPAHYWVNGSNYLSNIAEKVKNVELVFRRETFSLTQACKTIRMSYRDLRVPETYQGQVIEQGHISFEHIHQDLFNF